MKTVKTCELIGLALDWAAGIADGRELELPGAVRGRTGIVWCEPFEVRLQGEVIGHDKSRRYWQPSSNWAQGGPLIEKYKLHLHCDEPSASFIQQGMRIGYTASTVLIAACRAIVAAKLGDTVQIPNELWTAQNDTAPTSRADSENAGASH